MVKFKKNDSSTDANNIDKTSDVSYGSVRKPNWVEFANLEDDSLLNKMLFKPALRFNSITPGLFSKTSPSVSGSMFSSSALPESERPPSYRFSDSALSNKLNDGYSTSDQGSLPANQITSSLSLRRRNTIAVVLVLIALLAVIASAIGIVMYLSHPKDMLRATVHMTVKNHNFSDEMSNTSSPEFKGIERPLCAEMDIYYLTSEMAEHYLGCSLVSLSNGKSRPGVDAILNLDFHDNTVTNDRPRIEGVILKKSGRFKDDNHLYLVVRKFLVYLRSLRIFLEVIPMPDPPPGVFRPVIPWREDIDFISSKSTIGSQPIKPSLTVKIFQMFPAHIMRPGGWVPVILNPVANHAHISSNTIVPMSSLTHQSVYVSVLYTSNTITYTDTADIMPQTSSFLAESGISTIMRGITKQQHYTSSGNHWTHRDFGIAPTTTVLPIRSTSVSKSSTLTQVDVGPGIADTEFASRLTRDYIDQDTLPLLIDRFEIIPSKTVSWTSIRGKEIDTNELMRRRQTVKYDFTNSLEPSEERVSSQTEYSTIPTDFLSSSKTFLLKDLPTQTVVQTQGMTDDVKQESNLLSVHMISHVVPHASTEFRDVANLVDILHGTNVILREHEIIFGKNVPITDQFPSLNTTKGLDINTKKEQRKPNGKVINQDSGLFLIRGNGGNSNNTTANSKNNNVNKIKVNSIKHKTHDVGALNPVEILKKHTSQRNEKLSSDTNNAQLLPSLNEFGFTSLLYEQPSIPYSTSIPIKVIRTTPAIDTTSRTKIKEPYMSTRTLPTLFPLIKQVTTFLELSERAIPDIKEFVFKDFPKIPLSTRKSRRSTKGPSNLDSVVPNGDSTHTLAKSKNSKIEEIVPSPGQVTIQLSNNNRNQIPFKSSSVSLVTFMPTFINTFQKPPMISELRVRGNGKTRKSDPDKVQFINTFDVRISRTDSRLGTEASEHSTVPNLNRTLWSFLDPPKPARQVPGHISNNQRPVLHIPEIELLGNEIDIEVKRKLRPRKKKRRPPIIQETMENGNVLFIVPKPSGTKWNAVNQRVPIQIPKARPNNVIKATTNNRVLSRNNRGFQQRVIPGRARGHVRQTVTVITKHINRQPTVRQLANRQPTNRQASNIQHINKNPTHRQTWNFLENRGINPSLQSMYIPARSPPLRPTQRRQGGYGKGSYYYGSYTTNTQQIWYTPRENGPNILTQQQQHLYRARQIQTARRRYLLRMKYIQRQMFLQQQFYSNGPMQVMG